MKGKWVTEYNTAPAFVFECTILTHPPLPRSAQLILAHAANALAPSHIPVERQADAATVPIFHRAVVGHQTYGESGLPSIGPSALDLCLLEENTQHCRIRGTKRNNVAMYGLKCFSRCIAQYLGPAYFPLFLFAALTPLLVGRVSILLHSFAIG